MGTHAEPDTLMDTEAFVAMLLLLGFERGHSHQRVNYEYRDANDSLLIDVYLADTNSRLCFVFIQSKENFPCDWTDADYQLQYEDAGKLAADHIQFYKEFYDGE